ncbi:MAG: DNA-binding response regulator [Flavobacterium sp. BFFFF2]|nr:MAG: DNA-binding response regulator [Flavobacterium sp. BFFFF2]
MIRVLIAEDHQSVVDGVKLALNNEPDLCLVGSVTDGVQLLEQTAILTPDVVITDIRMPNMSGVEATREIAKRFPNIPVIAFSMFDNPEVFAQMKQAGAKGYLLKIASLATLVDAIRVVAAGDYFFDPLLMKSALPNPELMLSPRERDIVRCIGQGKSSQEIADTLFISKETVNTHRKNILKKIQEYGMSDLVRFAMELNLET